MFPSRGKFSEEASSKIMLTYLRGWWKLLNSRKQVQNKECSTSSSKWTLAKSRGMFIIKLKLNAFKCEHKTKWRNGEQKALEEHLFLLIICFLSLLSHSKFLNTKFSFHSLLSPSWTCSQCLPSCSFQLKLIITQITNQNVNRIKSFFDLKGEKLFSWSEKIIF